MQKLKGQSPVPQQHVLGCAVACVAFRSNKTYRLAHKAFQVRSLAWDRGYYCKEVVEALASLGYNYTHRKYRKSDSHLLKIEGTIVFVARSAKYPLGHYLVKSKRGWMNSWSNCPEIMPLKSQFQKRLPGRVEYILCEF